MTNADNNTTNMTTINLTDNNLIIHTDGNGRWSTTRAAVQIIAVQIIETPAEPQYGWGASVRIAAFFNGEHWNTNEDGLIYTDDRALTELRAVLADHVDHDLSKMDYTEQGMQGGNYISLELTH